MQKEKKFCEIYGKGTVTDRMSQKWFVKFHARDFLLDYALQSSRPVEVLVIKSRQINWGQSTLYTWEIANSKYPSQALKSICTSLDMLICVWVPYKLREKNLLTLFLNMILYLYVNKNILSLKQIVTMMKSTFCKIMWTGRHPGASKMSHHQLHQRPVFIQRRWYVYMVELGVLYYGLFLENQTINSSKYCSQLGIPGGSVVVNNPPAKARDMVSIHGLGRSPGNRNGNPLQYSHLGNSMNRGPWWATVNGVSKSVTHNLVTKQQQKLLPVRPT